MKILSTSVLLTMALGGIAFTGHTEAKTEVEVNWENPEKYRDVRPSNQSSKRFRETTFKRIDEYVSELAMSLPDNKKLIITVSDLDLAGRVWPASFVGFGHSGSDVRLIKDIDIPRIDFTYQLVDQAGSIVQEAEVKLKDMAFLQRSNRLFRSEPLRYEKNMLRNWFNKEFSHYLVPQNTDETNT